jgi:hypothetical protein
VASLSYDCTCCSLVRFFLLPHDIMAVLHLTTQISHFCTRLLLTLLSSTGRLPQQVPLPGHYWYVEHRPSFVGNSRCTTISASLLYSAGSSHSRTHHCRQRSWLHNQSQSKLGYNTYDGNLQPLEPEYSHSLQNVPNAHLLHS